MQIVSSNGGHSFQRISDMKFHVNTQFTPKIRFVKFILLKKELIIKNYLQHNQKWNCKWEDIFTTTEETFLISFSRYKDFMLEFPFSSPHIFSVPQTKQSRSKTIAGFIENDCLFKTLQSWRHLFIRLTSYWREIFKSIFIYKQEAHRS